MLTGAFLIAMDLEPRIGLVSSNQYLNYSQFTQHHSSEATTALDDSKAFNTAGPRHDFNSY